MRQVLCIVIASLAACSSGGGDPDPGPERLEPLPGTGQVGIEMNGLWVVDDVVVLEETPRSPGPPLTRPAGMIPVEVDCELRIEGDQATFADTRDLARDASGHESVRDYLNHVDGRLALYRRYVSSPSDPQIPDSGGSVLLQFALGSVAADTMAGLVEHRLAVAFLPGNIPVRGLYQVRLRRAASPAQLGQPGRPEPSARPAQDARPR